MEFVKAFIQDFLLIFALESLDCPSRLEGKHSYQIHYCGFEELITFSLPLSQKVYTPEIITAISHILSVYLSRFNVVAAHGQKREWGVGNKSTYDNLDTKMSGTRMYMKQVKSPT